MKSNELIRYPQPYFKQQQLGIAPGVLEAGAAVLNIGASLIQSITAVEVAKEQTRAMISVANIQKQMQEENNKTQLLLQQRQGDLQKALMQTQLNEQVRVEQRMDKFNQLKTYWDIYYQQVAQLNVVKTIARNIPYVQSSTQIPILKGLNLAGWDGGEKYYPINGWGIKWGDDNGGYSNEFLKYLSWCYLKKDSSWLLGGFNDRTKYDPNRTDLADYPIAYILHFFRTDRRVSYDSDPVRYSVDFLVENEKSYALNDSMAEHVKRDKTYFGSQKFSRVEDLWKFIDTIFYQFFRLGGGNISMPLDLSFDAFVSSEQYQAFKKDNLQKFVFEGGGATSIVRSMAVRNDIFNTHNIYVPAGKDPKGNDRTKKAHTFEILEFREESYWPGFPNGIKYDTITQPQNNIRNKVEYVYQDEEVAFKALVSKYLEPIYVYQSFEEAMLQLSNASVSFDKITEVWDASFSKIAKEGIFYETKLMPFLEAEGDEKQASINRLALFLFSKNFDFVSTSSSSSLVAQKLKAINEEMMKPNSPYHRLKKDITSLKDYRKNLPFIAEGETDAYLAEALVGNLDVMNKIFGQLKVASEDSRQVVYGQMLMDVVQKLYNDQQYHLAIYLLDYTLKNGIVTTKEIVEGLRQVSDNIRAAASENIAATFNDFSYRQFAPPAPAWKSYFSDTASKAIGTDGAVLFPTSISINAQGKEETKNHYDLLKEALNQWQLQFSFDIPNVVAVLVAGQINLNDPKNFSYQEGAIQIKAQGKTYLFTANFFWELLRKFEKKSLDDATLRLAEQMQSVKENQLFPKAPDSEIDAVNRAIALINQGTFTQEDVEKALAAYHDGAVGVQITSAKTPSIKSDWLSTDAYLYLLSTLYKHPESKTPPVVKKAGGGGVVALIATAAIPFLLGGGKS